MSRLLPLLLRTCRVLISGSGGLSIGQAGGFDYSLDLKCTYPSLLSSAFWRLKRWRRLYRSCQPQHAYQTSRTCDKFARVNGWEGYEWKVDRIVSLLVARLLLMSGSSESEFYALELSSIVISYFFGLDLIHGFWAPNTLSVTGDQGTLCSDYECHWKMRRVGSATSTAAAFRAAKHINNYPVIVRAAFALGAG
jgi:hypothetical protein